MVEKLSAHDRPTPDPQELTPGAPRNCSTHKRAWNRWERNRENDHKWLALATLTDFWARKRYGDHTIEGALREAWRQIRASIILGEFSIGGKSRVLLVCPGDLCWWITPEILQGRPFPEKGQPDPTGDAQNLIDGYLSQCWVPSDLAVRWLETYQVTLPDNLLPSFPRGVLPVDRLGEPPPPATPSPPPGYLFIDQAVKQIRTRLPDLTARRASDRLLEAFRDGEFETHKKADNHLNTSRGRTRKLRWSSWDTAAIDLEEFIEQGHGGVLFEGKHWHLREFLIEGDGFVQWLNKIAPIATAAHSASEVASSNILSAGNTIRQPTFLKNKPGPAPELRTKIANQMLSDYAAEPEKLAAEKQESLKTRCSGPIT